MLLRSTADRAELASDLAMLDNEDRVFYFAIPEQYRSDWDECRHQERLLAKASLHQLPGRVLELAPTALERCPQPEVRLYQLEALVQLGRYEQAEPVARQLIAAAPHDRRSHGRIAALAGVTLLERGYTLEAKPLIEMAVRLGTLTCASFIQLAEAARRNARPVEAAEHAESAYVCGGRRDPSLLVAAATWLTAAGERARALSVLARIRGLGLTPDQAEQVAALERSLK
jgi:tetratricopeptide (TPR) repeat protein